VVAKTAYLDSLTATFVSRNSAASFFCINILIAVALIQQEMSRDPNSSRYSLWRGLFRAMESNSTFYAAAGLIIYAALLLTGSRAGVVVTMIGVVALFGLSRVKQNAAKGTIGVPILLGGGLVLAIAAAVNALLIRADGATQSNASRISLYREALSAIADRPLLGHGGGAYENVEPLYRRPETPVEFIFNNAHNTYLEAVASVGVPAAALSFLLAGYLVSRIFKRYRQGVRAMPCSLAALSAYAALGIHAAVDASLEVQANALYLAVLTGLAIGEGLASQAKQSYVASLPRKQLVPRRTEAGLAG
jgi:O-antigen ligase